MYDNPVGVLTNFTERWWEHPTNAVMFFTNAAELMWRASIDEIVTIPDVDAAASEKAAAELLEPAPEEDLDDEA